ncbi:MAG: alkaline phosphatase family protein [Verrucomicrobiota bacterium]
MMLNFVCRILLLIAIPFAAAPAFAAPRAKHVFIISIDGGKPDEILRSEMPVLKKLVKQGAHTWAANTITPSLTLPAHTSMLTGVGMARHKISWNNWTPSNGIVTVPTIFGAAKQEGFSTAMFVGKEKFRHLLQPGTVDEFNMNRREEVVISKSDSGGEVKKKEGNVFAKFVADEAASYILKNKPGLTFIHFTDADTIGHVSGWGSPEQRNAFADVDVALGVVMKAIRKAGIARESVIIISADHGGHDKGHSKGEPEDMHIPWIAWGKGVKKGFEITAPVGTCDTAATALWLLDVKPIAPMEGMVVNSAFK